MIGALSAPYLLSSPQAFVRDLLYSADKLPGGLSWQVVLHGLPAGVQVSVGDVLLGAFVVVAIALAFLDDLAVASVAAMLLFLVFSKQVIEQYLVWPLPLLALLVVDQRSRVALFLVATLTAAGLVVNAYFHPFGLQPAAINVAFAALVIGGVARLLREHRRGPTTRGAAPGVGWGGVVSAGAPLPARMVALGQLGWSASASARPWRAPPPTPPGPRPRRRAG